MKSTQASNVTRTPVVWGMILGIVLAFLVGCGSDRATAPERTWEEIRYHRSEDLANGGYGDLIIRASGEIRLELPGERATTRGLLAGENLETLARLLDSLPPANFQGTVDCEESFFLSVRQEDESRTYSAGVCDDGLPTPLRAVVDQLEAWILDATGIKTEPVAYRALANGMRARVSVESHRFIESRDDLVQSLPLLGEDRPTVLPAVDFKHEIVVAIFAGRQIGVSSIAVANARRTEGGQIVITERWEVPDGDCIGNDPSTPYVLVAISASSADDFLFEQERVAHACGDEQGRP